MKILLDTHIWLWYLIGDKNLSSNHKRIIESEESDLWLSSISIWETNVLIDKKRLPISSEASIWIRKALKSFPVKEAKITFEIALKSRTLIIPTDDPADRFIAATALENDMSLITADKKIAKCKDIKIIH